MPKIWPVFENSGQPVGVVAHGVVRSNSAGLVLLVRAIGPGAPRTCEAAIDLPANCWIWRGCRAVDLLGAEKRRLTSSSGPARKPPRFSLSVTPFLLLGAARA